jgi:hypothetical protein
MAGVIPRGGGQRPRGLPETNPLSWRPAACGAQRRIGIPGACSSKQWKWGDVPSVLT